MAMGACCVTCHVHGECLTINSLQLSLPYKARRRNTCCFIVCTSSVAARGHPAGLAKHPCSKTKPAASPCATPSRPTPHPMVAREQHVDLIQDHQRAVAPPHHPQLLLPNAKSLLEGLPCPGSGGTSIRQQHVGLRQQTTGLLAWCPQQLPARLSEATCHMHHTCTSACKHLRCCSQDTSQRVWPPATHTNGCDQCTHSTRPHPPGWPQPLPRQLLPQACEHMVGRGQLQAVEDHQLCGSGGARPLLLLLCTEGSQHLHHAGCLACARHATDVLDAALCAQGSSGIGAMCQLGGCGPSFQQPCGTSSACIPCTQPVQAGWVSARVTLYLSIYCLVNTSCWYRCPVRVQAGSLGLCICTNDGVRPATLLLADTCKCTVLYCRAVNRMPGTAPEQHVLTTAHTIWSGNQS
jgi:hypothetical protein